MNIINPKSDYHINIVYCGGSCTTYYGEYNHTLKLYMSEYSNSHMIVSSSNWSDYNDFIKYRDSKWYLMISNGCFVSIPQPNNVNTDYGDECVVIKITNDNNDES